MNDAPESTEHCSDSQAYDTPQRESDSTLGSLKRQKTSHPGLDEDGSFVIFPSTTSEMEGSNISTNGGHDAPPSPTKSEWSWYHSSDEYNFGTPPPASSSTVDNVDAADTNTVMDDAPPLTITLQKKPARANSLSSGLDPDRGPKMGISEVLKKAICERLNWWDYPATSANHAFVQSTSSDNYALSNNVTQIADMVLDVVPYFETQATIDATAKGKTTRDALYTTPICVDQEKRLQVTLEQLFTLVPRYGGDAWLEDTLMDPLVQLMAPPYQPDKMWFCTDGMFQFWTLEIDPFGKLDDLGDMILIESQKMALPAREIPEDADSMVFFYNPSKVHWMTVLAHVDPKTNLGQIDIFNSCGNYFQGNEWSGTVKDYLPRLMHCIAYNSRNEAFAKADWFNASVVNQSCPQQGEANIDCGVFSVHAASSLLRRQWPRDGWHTDETYRVQHGIRLRQKYMRILKANLDLTAVSKATAIELASNGGRRWSTSK